MPGRAARMTATCAIELTQLVYRSSSSSAALFVARAAASAGRSARPSRARAIAPPSGSSAGFARAPESELTPSSTCRRAPSPSPSPSSASPASPAPPKPRAASHAGSSSTKRASSTPYFARNSASVGARPAQTS